MQEMTTDDVILSRRPELWQDFFKLTEEADLPQDFLSDRHDQAPQKRRLFV